MSHAPHALLLAYLTAPAASVTTLGPNVKVFDSSMPVAEIQAAVDAIAAEQVGNQFGTERLRGIFTVPAVSMWAIPRSLRPVISAIATAGKDQGRSLQPPAN